LPRTRPAWAGWTGRAGRLYGDISDVDLLGDGQRIIHLDPEIPDRGPQSEYAHADDVAPIEVTDRARVRLHCTNAIQGATEVADFAYKGAGVDAIFPGSPFERRFRDMHTLSQSQQIQATRRPFRVGWADPPRRAPEEFL
jgi:hypothetical protein